MIRLFSRKRKEDPAEREKMALLERVEAEAQDLRERADMAVYVMRHRDRRNHWQESIHEMIWGVRR